MRYAWLLLGYFGAYFFAAAIAFPPHDGDLYWQRWLGATIVATGHVPRALGSEAFAAPNAPWVPQEWLFAIAASASRGPLGRIVFSSACALGALGALAIACALAVRRGASVRAAALCALFGGIGLRASFGVRAQVVVWPLFALFLFVLDIDGPWCYAAIAVAAVWSNVHASALLAPILAAASALGSAFDERGLGKRTRRLALVTVLCAVAICCNPLGWDLPRYAIGLYNNPIKTYIVEWKVTDIDDTSFAYGALPLLLLAMVLGTRGASGRGWRDFFVLTTMGFLLLSAARNVPLFSIAAIGIVAPALTRRFATFARFATAAPAKRDRAANLAIAAGALLGGIALGWRLVATAPAPTTLANAPLAALTKLPGEHRVLCEDFAWCSLLLGVPHERVFIDGRADPFPRNVWHDYVAMELLEPSWHELLDRYAIDAVVVTRSAPLDQALAIVGGWRAAYTDKTYRLWLRSLNRT
jgi:hypothetical protein